MDRRLAYAVFISLIGCAATDCGAEPRRGEPRRASEQDAAQVQRISARDVVRASSNRDSLERAASALARSSEPEDLRLLGQLLRDGRFLTRLDDPTNGPTRHLRNVLAALGARQSQQAEEVALALLDHPLYQLLDRKGLVLTALAVARPMSARTARAFREANEQGYFAFDSPLLAANASPRAMEVFQSMMLDRTVPVARRVDCLHLAIVPRRVELAVLQAADSILTHASERELVAGVTESVFDYQPLWFGLGASVPKPPAWERGTVASLQTALRIADKALARSDVSPSLQQVVRQSRAMIAGAIAARRA
jgi:hypothetical protein